MVSDNGEEESVSLTAEELNRLFNIGIALSSEQDMDVLLESILTAAQEFCNAEGGTLYLMDHEHNQLTFSILRNDKLNIKIGGTSEKKATPFPPLYLYNPETNEPNYSNISTYAALTEQIVNVKDAYDSTQFDFSGTHTFDEKSGYRSKSFLTVPLKTRTGQVVAVLQLINARAPSGETIPFSKSMQRLVEALSSHAAVAIDNQLLLSSQRNLLESFLEVIARAIDDKSLYTGAHCQRVPVIARMVAMAAVLDQEGPFKDFELSDNEWYAFHLASWMHDCGKMKIPEYILDKATKLETVNNRIHEIRARFEILYRDAHIDYLKKRLAATASKEILLAEFNARVKKLEEDFAFLAKSNVGYDLLSDEDIQRIYEIGRQTYYRHFDKTLGLSWDEMDRIKGEMPPKTNPKEPLLEDRADHVFGGCNRGEVHNLTIARGTLTSEEAKKINSHIDATIEMLKEIPFPPYVKNVVEYAAAHHEHMDGTGFPNHLKREQMSIPARILGLADVFEALSNSDRPYKKVKTLSEIITIMSDMAKGGHLDPDVFNLFLTSGVYREYAEQYMKENQIDDVNIEAYLAPSTEDLEG
ncbi:MAG: GAF domain-containing protein [Alphaproteobacteria bacterium]|nr:GAF domain-containing protein [Alphaproteobacteria bacterium]